MVIIKKAAAPPWRLPRPLAPTGATTTLHNGSAPAPLPWPPMVTDPWFPFRRRCAGGSPSPSPPYVFLPHLALLGWLKGGQGVEFALIDLLDFTRGS